MENLIHRAKSPKGSALETVFINSAEGKEAFRRWYFQGPEPTNGSILEYDYDKADFELFYHLANFMFEAGREYEISQKR